MHAATEERKHGVRGRGARRSYGGPRAHLRALPFFLGLLAGAATEGTLHRLIAEILGVRV